MGQQTIPVLKDKFADGKTPTGADFGDVFDSYLHKSAKINQSQILGLNDALADKASKADLANVTTNFKGYHVSLEALQTAYPQAGNKKDFFAWVGSPYPGTVYKVYADGGAWTDTGEVPAQQEIDLAGYVKEENLTGVFENKNTARQSVEAGRRQSGIILSYRVRKFAQNQIVETILPTSIEQGKAINATTGVIITTGNNQVFRFDFATSVIQITLRGVNTNTNIGGVFYTSSGKFISGFYFSVSQIRNGDLVTVNVPTDAAYLLYSYVSDAWGEANNIPKLERADIVRVEQEELNPENIVEKYRGEVDGWLLDDNWSTLSDARRTNSADDLSETGVYLIKGEYSSNYSMLYENKYMTPTGALVADAWSDVWCFNDVFPNMSLTISCYMSNLWSNSVLFVDASNNIVSAFNFGASGINNKAVIVPNDSRITGLIVMNSRYDARPAPTVIVLASPYIVEHDERAAAQVRKPFARSGLEYRRTRTNGFWSPWEIRDVVISTDGDFITPNMFATGSQIERLNAAVELGASTGKKIVIPKIDEVTQSNVWLIDSAILLPSNVYIELDNCKIKLSDRCRDNHFRTKNLFVGQPTIDPLENIHVKGNGNAILEGADNPRSTGDWNKVLTLSSSGGWNSYGTDAGKAGENQYGGWLNYSIVVCNTKNFSFSGIRFVEPHAWSMAIDNSSFGVVENMVINASGGRVIAGKRQLFRNQGAIIAVQGCHDLIFKNISGNNSDDIMMIGCLLVPSTSQHAATHSTGNQNTHSPSGDVYKGTIDDTYNITIQDIMADATADGQNYAIIKFTPSYQQKQYNIVVERLYSAAANKITFDYYNGGSPNIGAGAGKNIAYTFRDIANNIKFISNNGGQVQDSLFSNIVYSGTGDPIGVGKDAKYNNIFENIRNVTL